MYRSYLLFGAMLLLLATIIVGCGTNPLMMEPTAGGRDTIVVISPPDTTCKTCPPDTTHPGDCESSPTKGGRIHEAQSHLTVATVTVASRRDTLWLVLPVEYEDGRSQQNENWHAYVRNVADFSQKYDFLFPPTGTQVVPDPPGFEGWLTRQLVLTGVPAGTYDLVLQQDLPNHYAPGESDIHFGPGTITVCK